MELKWSDATSYSQGQRGRAPQTAWETEINGFKVWVSCGHRYYPDSWVMNCRALGLEEKTLGATDISSEQARNLAVSLVISEARKRARELNSLADAASSVAPLRSRRSSNPTKGKAHGSNN